MKAFNHRRFWVFLVLFSVLPLLLMHSVRGGEASSRDSSPESDWNQFKYSGTVVDHRGNPVANVQVMVTIRYALDMDGMSYTAETKTNKAGYFSIDTQRALSGETPEGFSDNESVRIEFTHPDFVYAKLEDVHLIPPQARTQLQIRLRDGATVHGRAVDPAGKPVAGAMVQAMFGLKSNNELAQGNLRKAILTDSDGNFQLRGLIPDPIEIQIVQKNRGVFGIGSASVDLRSNELAGDVTVRPYKFPSDVKVHSLFGMKLLDMTDQIRKDLFLPESAYILVLDPGPNSARLDIGSIAQGNAFWMADNSLVKNFDEFAQHLLARCNQQKQQGYSSFAVQVVYNFSTLDFQGTNTQHMRLTPADVQELEKTVKPAQTSAP